MLAAEPAHTQLSRFYQGLYLWHKMCDVAYQALSQFVQQWEGPGDEAT